jgi:hypothetical protein
MNPLLTLGATLCSLLVAGCASVASAPPSSPHATIAPSSTATVSPAKTPVASPTATRGLHHVHDPGQVTGNLTGPCHYGDGGQLPDPHCTPGAIDTSVTAAVLCASGYSTRSYRPPVYQTSRFKYESAYPAYSVPSGTPTELDHLVSLELGGDNDASNLWPESPSTPNPKDKVENALHAAVCAGRVKLPAAQRAIAKNWITAEQVLGLNASTSPADTNRAVTPRASRAAMPRTATPRATHTAAPRTAACHPVSSGGNCYRRGEFCPKADRGISGISGNGTSITCELLNGRWRWE